MAGHVTNLATKFEHPKAIRSWFMSYNVSHWLPLRMRTRPLRMRRITRWRHFWEFYPKDGDVSDSFTRQMAAWEFCLQDGGVSDSFAHKMAAWEICLQDGGNKQKVNKNNVEYISSERHVTVRQFNVWRQTLNCLTVDRDAVNIR